MAADKTNAGARRLLKGEVVRDVRENLRYRILYTSAESDAGFWICMDSSGNIPKPISPQEVLDRLDARQYEPVIDTSRSRIPENPSSASIGIRDRAFELIRSLVEDEPAIYDAHRRANMLRAREKETGVKMNNIYAYLGRYWKGGMTPDALLPDLTRRGRGRSSSFVAAKRLGRPKKEGENGKILVPEDYEKFAEAIRGHYKSDTKPTLHDTYDWMISHLYTLPRFPGDTDPGQLPPDEKPSFMQFYYWHRKNRDAVGENKSREGGRYDLACRGTTGKSETHVMGPASVAQIDATIADFYLVRENSRDEVVGRPVVFFIKDVKTRMVMGMHVTLENASWDSALMALKNAAEDKVEYCRRFGIEITPGEWPCRHLPLSITADNGELGGAGVEGVIAQLGITVENTPPYRGDLKAVIENTFSQMDMSLRYIVPGHVDRDDGQRGAVNRRKEACLDIRSFTQLVIRSVLYYNNSHYMESYQKTPEMRARHVRPVPRELWNYGMQYEAGALRTVSREDICRVLLPRDRASVTESGICFGGLYYTCAPAQEESWFDKARSSGRWKVPVTYDPTCVDHIYIHSDDGGMITCSLLDRSAMYSGSSAQDMARAKEEDGLEKAAWSQEQERAKTSLILEAEAVVKRCRASKNAAGKAAVGNVLDKHRIRAGRRAEIDEGSGRAAAIREQAQPPEDPADGQARAAGSAIDDAIDQALKDLGLFE